MRSDVVTGRKNTDPVIGSNSQGNICPARVDAPFFAWLMTPSSKTRAEPVVGILTGVDPGGLAVSPTLSSEK